MTERIRVNFEVAGNLYQLSLAKWFYGDKTIQKYTGSKPADEKTSGKTGQGIAVVHPEQCKRVLVKLVAVYTGAVGTAVGNAAQNDRPKRFTFYCDPDKAEDAMAQLPRKKIGGRSISRVYRPLQRRYV